MPKQNKILHFAASAARTLHLWPLIVRSGLFNSARRRKYPDTIVHLDVVLTECCTLRCKSCSNLMQYYHHPENLDADEVISSLRKVFAAMRVSQLKLLGGEPFVCQKTLIKVLEYLKDQTDRFDEVDIITNGTLIPSEECINAMKNTPKLKVVFSNYGELSSKLKEFSELCGKEEIAFDIVGDDSWWDFGGMKLREEKESKTQHRFDGCYSRRLCTSLYRGKLYVCPRQAHAIRLGLVPEESSELVDVMSPEFDDPSKLHDAIYALIDRKKRISSCKYCGCDDWIKVPRAVQAERPLDVT